MRQLRIAQSITNREAASLDKYLRDIGQIDMITHEEEVQLALLIQQGDEVAVQKLLQAHLRFVVSVAKQYQNQGLPLGDLISEGNIGMLKAAKRYDHTKGFKFISLAVWWIRQTILVAIAEQARIVRLPLNQVGSLSKIGKAFSRLEQEYEREPTMDELAEILETTPEKVAETWMHSGKHVSVYEQFVKGEEGTLLDILDNGDAPTDSALDMESLRTEIKRALQNIPPKERKVIVLLFGLGTNRPLTLEEVAKEMKLTRERIRQIKDKALGMLRSPYRSQNLLPYVN